ncbi:hypothetical protein BZ160_06740 [Pantoea vagans]|nr:hypothetical protein BZ160_06740 [Pantoea vagans]
MARLRAHLRDEVRNRSGRAVRDGLSDFPICPCSLSRLNLIANRARRCQSSKALLFRRAFLCAAAASFTDPSKTLPDCLPAPAGRGSDAANADSAPGS